MHWISQRVGTKPNRSVAGLMGSYDCVRRMIVSFLESVSFCFLCTVDAAQEVCAPNEG